jgi:hypothetical protein
MASSAQAALFESLVHLKASGSDLETLTTELKQLDQNPNEYWYAMGSRLEKIHNNYLYRTGGYKSFADFCNRGVGYSRQHVYKLIKLVQFIDQLWDQAETPELRARAQRLFGFGFTKLYLLHSLPHDTLERLLSEGVAILVNNFYPERTVSLEEITLSGLRRALLLEPVKPRRQSLQSIQPLASMLNTQASTLLQVINRCQIHLDDREALLDQLRLAEEYASNIYEFINRLCNDGSEAPRPVAIAEEESNNN